MTSVLECPECGRELPTYAAFCLGCGHDLRAAAEAAEARVGTRSANAAAPTVICPACGVIAPTEREQCALCGASIEEPREVPFGGDLWVGVRCHFQCRSCGHLSPLNGLDTDGSVQCHHCGLDQAFDTDVWDEGLAHCHAVGDLAGPAAEGRHPHPVVALLDVNPFADIGVDRTSADLNLSGTSTRDGVTVRRSLRISASPGHPLCEHCAVPLDHETRGPQLTVTCPDCGETAVYDIPLPALNYNDALQGVRAEALRSDRMQVKASPHGGVIALSCPSCGAGLIDLGDGSVVTCTFCKTTARIPDRLMLRYMDRKPAAETWWMLFQGPSSLRADIEAGKVGGMAGGKAGGMTGATEDTPERSLPHGIERATEVKAPRAIRLIIGVVVPTIFVMVMMLAAFLDKIIALLS